MAFISNTYKFGVVAGGAGAAAAQLAGPWLASKSLAKDPTSKVAAFVLMNPWASGLGVAAAVGGALWATKRKEAAIAALVSGALVSAPSAVGAILAKMQSPAALPPAASPTNGFGVAVAEPRGMGAAPRIELFSAAPESIQLLAAPNAPESMGVQPALNPAVFGGSSF